MPDKPPPKGMETFKKNARMRMAAMGITEASGGDKKVWEMVIKRRSGEKISPKTVNNALQARHDSKVSTLAAIAEALQVDLWMMFHEGIREADLRPPMKERIADLVAQYLACDDEGRQQVENMAKAFAAKSKIKGST